MCTPTDLYACAPMIKYMHMYFPRSEKPIVIRLFLLLNFNRDTILLELELIQVLFHREADQTDQV